MTTPVTARVDAFALDAARLTGRALLGLYFILPGLMKITGYGATASTMVAHDVPLVPLLLPLTILVQVGGGLCLVAGFRARLMAFLLAGLTLVISFYMHDFWTYPAGLEKAHETQNFIKNLAIMAGLLYVAGTPRAPDRDDSAAPVAETAAARPR